MSSKSRVAQTAGLLSTAIGLIGFSTSATAQEGTSGFYVGAFGGQTTYDIAKQDMDDLFLFAGDVVGLPILGGESSLEDSDTGFGVIAGFRLTPYVAIEASYMDLGAAEYRLDGLANLGSTFGVVAFEGGADIEVSGPAVALVGIIPVSETIELYGKAGMFFSETDFTVFFDSIAESASFSSEEILYGVGMAWNLNPNWSLRLDFQRFADVGEEDELGEANIDQFSLGVLYRL
jgi:opacity protein-like surface antigen